LREYTEPSNPICLTSPRARGEVFTKLLRIPNVQLIYVSALACTRHRSIDFIEMQRKGRLSFLLFNEVDMITGDYIDKTKQAAAEIAAERNPSGIILLTGCQSALLSTDYKLLSEEIEQEIGVPVRVHDGCRLCGFDEEAGGSSAIDQMLYAFIRPSEKSVEPSVNILGSTDLDESSELFSILNAAGVRKIHRLSACKTFADYQQMGTAHVNIITSAQDMEIGAHLEETLGIPWVCLGGIYDGAELEASYIKLARILGTEIDTSVFRSKLAAALQSAKASAGDTPITVEGDVELTKWLLSEGFRVESLRLNPHQGLSSDQRSWFEQHAPGLRVEGAKRGGPGGHGKPGGHGGERGRGKPGGKPQSGAEIKPGFAGSLSALNQLIHSTGGAHHE